MKTTDGEYALTLHVYTVKVETAAEIFALVPGESVVVDPPPSDPGEIVDCGFFGGRSRYRHLHELELLPKIRIYDDCIE